ncbi:MAG TPA: hypothetical protein VJR04_12900 [Terriglobales bacterium]|nr:hypothetical protein [Terriglobales bacterium]
MLIKEFCALNFPAGIRLQGNRSSHRKLLLAHLKTKHQCKSMDLESKPTHATKAAWGTMFAGAALSVYGWTRKSASGAALGLAGGAIALKAASAGPIADLVGTETSLSQSVIMMATPPDIYSFCKNAAKTALWIGGIRELPSARQSQMKDNSDPIRGIADAELRVVDDVPEQHIRWHLVDPRRGYRDCVAELRLGDQAAARGTLVTLTLRYKVHTGMIHSNAPQIIGADPQRHLRESLRKLKMLIEAGEIATVRGQSHGPRTFKGKLMGTLLGEEVA